MRPLALAASLLLLSAVLVTAAPAAAAQACVLDASSGEFACVVESHEVCRPGSWCIDTPRICAGTLC